MLVTSYSGLRQHQERLLAQRFDYIILDEGHKIRNPDAEITLACKQVKFSYYLTFLASKYIFGSTVYVAVQIKFLVYYLVYNCFF